MPKLVRGKTPNPGRVSTFDQQTSPLSGALDVVASGLSAGADMIVANNEKKRLAEEKQAEFDLEISKNRYLVERENRRLNRQNSGLMPNEYLDIDKQDEEELSSNFLATPAHYSKEVQAKYAQEVLKFRSDEEVKVTKKNNTFFESEREALVKADFKDMLDISKNNIRTSAKIDVPEFLSPQDQQVQTFASPVTGTIASASSLTAFLESNNNPLAVANDTGGTLSFGAFQFNNRRSDGRKDSTLDAVIKYAKQADPELAEAMSKETALFGSDKKAALAAFKKLGDKHPNLAAIQEGAFQEIFVEKAKRNLFNTHNVDISKVHPVVMSTLVSLNTKFGQNSNSFSRIVAQNVDKDPIEIVEAMLEKAASKSADPNRYRKTLNAAKKQLVEGELTLTSKLSTPLKKADSLEDITATEEGPLDLRQVDSIKRHVSMIKDTIGKLPLSAAERRALLEEETGEAVMNYMAEMVEHNPLMARRIINSGQLDADITPDQREDVLKEVSRSETKKVAKFNEALKEQNAVAEAQINNIIDAGEYTQAQQALAQSGLPLVNQLKISGEIDKNIRADEELRVQKKSEGTYGDYIFEKDEALRDNLLNGLESGNFVEASAAINTFISKQRDNGVREEDIQVLPTEVVEREVKKIQESNDPLDQMHKLGVAVRRDNFFNVVQDLEDAGLSEGYKNAFYLDSDGKSGIASEMITTIRENNGVWTGNMQYSQDLLFANKPRLAREILNGERVIINANNKDDILSKDTSVTSATDSITGSSGTKPTVGKEIIKYIGEATAFNGYERQSMINASIAIMNARGIVEPSVEDVQSVVDEVTGGIVQRKSGGAFSGRRGSKFILPYMYDGNVTEFDRDIAQVSAEDFEGVMLKQPGREGVIIKDADILEVFKDADFVSTDLLQADYPSKKAMLMDEKNSIDPSHRELMVVSQKYGDIPLVNADGSLFVIDQDFLSKLRQRRSRQAKMTIPVRGF